MIWITAPGRRPLKPAGGVAAAPQWAVEPKASHFTESQEGEAGAANEPSPEEELDLPLQSNQLPKNSLSHVVYS